MLRNRCMPAVATLAFAALTLAVPASAQSVDDIIAKHIQARGGMEKLKAITSIRETASMTVGPGLEAPAILEQKRPDSIRIEFTIQGMTGVQAYDGHTGWQIMPFEGKKDADTLGEDDLKAIQDQADFDGAIVDYKQKGSTVELVGKESVEGSDAYKLKVSLKSGTVLYDFLDADSYMLIKEEAVRNVRGQEQIIDTVLGDYKEEGGAMFAHSFELKPQGGAGQGFKATITKIEVNPTGDRAIAESRFSMPPAPKPEAKPEEKKP